MTPAVEAARKAGISHRIHSYRHDSGNQAYGAEAADKLGLSPQQVFKTLVVMLESRELAVTVLPVARQLSLKACGRALNAKKVAMADPAHVQRSTGYVLGGVSPLGQKRRLRTVIDSAAWDFETIFVSAGRRGLEIELAPDDLRRLTEAVRAPIAATPSAS